MPFQEAPGWSTSGRPHIFSPVLTLAPPAAAAAASESASAAAVSFLWMRSRMSEYRMSGCGDRCGRDGCGVTHGCCRRVEGRASESVRTAGWSCCTAACPAPAGSA